jgi:inward rectifier potassium channel
MFRIINVRPSEVIDVQCRVNLAWFEEVDGKRVRNFHQLALERNQIEFFSLQWVIVHPITAESPMHGLTPEQLRASEAEFFVLVSGTEESFSTRVHARSSYRFDEVRWDAKFADMFVASPDGIITVDVDRLDRMDRLPEGATRVPAAGEG